MSNYFEELNKINVNEKTEKKGGLTYLSWAWAWGELKKKHPEATYTIYENEVGWNYHTDGTSAWVKTGVTVNGIEHIEYLPIMDYKNHSIPTDKITSFDVNKAIQRSLTKAVARHGLGLYIYAGEDLPDEMDGAVESREPIDTTKKITASEANVIKDLIKLNGKTIKAMCEYLGIAKVEEMTKKQYVEIYNMLTNTKKGA